MNLYDLPNEILVEADGPVRIITLNRPQERNPASTSMLFALTRLAQELNADREARAAVLTRAGKAVSAAGD
jgi:enoyl-CoA hydratase/carnithine racemase